MNPDTGIRVGAVYRLSQEDLGRVFERRQMEIFTTEYGWMEGRILAGDLVIPVETLGGGSYYLYQLLEGRGTRGEGELYLEGVPAYRILHGATINAPPMGTLLEQQPTEAEYQRLMTGAITVFSGQ